ncbi:hypothetical protein ACTGJ9_024670 [Bradyrhizobium sp. RDM12]
MSIARPVTGYQGFVETCRERAEELSISRLEIDRLAGLTPGYSGKLLGNGKRKRIWPVGFEALLGVLGLQVLLVEDPIATARTLERREPVDHRQQRFGNYPRGPGAQLRLAAPEQRPIAPPQTKPPLESRAHLRVVQMKRRGKHG